MKTAITGGIGSGKSYVCRLLAERGIAVYDCDVAAKVIMRSDPDVRRELTLLVGPDAYGPNGRPDKGVLARFLLASEGNAQAIDAIVHPAVARHFLQSGSVWMECAILFESGFDRLVDRVVAVTAPDELRLQRVMARDGISLDKARQWLQRQWPQEEVRRRAHFEIVNDGLLPLGPQIDALLKAVATQAQPPQE